MEKKEILSERKLRAKERKKSRNREIKRHFGVLKNPFAVVFFSIMVLYAISLIIPFAWMLMTTFKDSIDFTIDKMAIPKLKDWNFDNYAVAWEKMYVTVTKTGQAPYDVHVPQLMFNGLVYSVGTVLWGLFINVITAYACARFDTKIGRFIHSFVIVVMIVPLVGSMGATLVTYRKLGIYDNFLGIVLASGGFGGTTFLILYGMFKGIPSSYSEAAEIDGASHLAVMVKIMFPMAVPTVLAFVVLNFIGAWNDYMTPMVYLKSMPTIAYGLFEFKNNSDSAAAQIPAQFAGSMVVVIPIAIVFLLFKDKIMTNLQLGGLKG